MRTLPFLNGMSEKEFLNTSSSLNDLNWDFEEFNTPGLPTPAPRPSLARPTPGSSASFHPHTRSRGPAIGYEVQTPPDIRIARWKRIDRKVSRQARRSEIFGRNRANSDTSLLYNLGTGEENLSFGDIRFEDSYNLAEPEPVLDPVILNFFFFFSNYFCCPRRCTYTILEGFYYIYTVYMYSITQHLTVFMVPCHENKVWFWVLFNIPPLPEALETATFGILSISVPVSWYSLTQVRYLPSATPPSQWVRILSIHYVQ